MGSYAPNPFIPNTVDFTNPDVTAIADYLDMTARLNDYNEISSLNQYVLNNNTIEYNKLQAVYNTISSQLLKMKQEYLLYDGAISKYKLWINIINITIIAISLCFIILALAISKYVPAGAESTSIFTQNKAAWICIIIAVIYTIIVMIVSSTEKNRRTYSWNQYYWNPPTPVANM